MTKAQIRIITPQFTRPPGEKKPKAPPKTAEAWAALRKKDSLQLRAMGLRTWDTSEDNATALMLLPGEWYPRIPDGLRLEDIFGKPVTFKAGKTDDDIRFGCLSYGIRVRHEEVPRKIQAAERKAAK